jgi:enamine deaminase RidA (YjgF/YER057c/UK114 family)
MGAVEQRLEELGIELPPAFAPVANFELVVRTGPLLFVSGHGPTGPDGRVVYQGSVSSEVSVDDAYAAARLTMLNCLRTIQDEVGTLDRVRRIVKLLGMVRSDPGFTEQPKVINGGSDLLVEVFGDRGRHARSAVGMAALPFGMPVEIEMIVEAESD